MSDCIVIGGGLSGLATAVALGSAGLRVQLFESRGFLGGRATSYPVDIGDQTEIIDNCQHVLLRCCVNLMDFYGRLRVADRIHFYREFYFLEPGGRISYLRAGHLPAPYHFTESFLTMKCLSTADKLSIAYGMQCIRREYGHRKDLDRITMLDWLKEKRQTRRSIERFWGQVLVSAINEELGRMAARHGFQVFWLGFLRHKNSYEMGVPVVPLAELYDSNAWQNLGNVEFRLRTPVERIWVERDAVYGITAAKREHTARFYVCALPFERLESVIPELDIKPDRFQHSPITGVHLWFDRTVTELPHAVLLDGTVQWFFNRDQGKYLQAVISASRSLLPMSKAEVVSLVLEELTRYLPEVHRAKLERSRVVKEVRATFSAAPGTEQARPEARTPFKNLFLAGDWTHSGWPATMEGAVRSGYLAAEAVTRAAGKPMEFVLPDLA
ncbi:MAG: hydroxysqualene dehydroxylase HpnE [Bryobacteraceae bacterium]|nr:hydroxysqualene dehydroxylase HpnE [Bryobacteraceae bacterium]